MVKVYIENHSLPDLVLKVCYACVVNLAEILVWDGIWLTVGSSYGHIVDETESARCVFSAVVTGRTHHTESSLRGSWSRLKIVTSI